MKIDKVTITGADNDTDQLELLKLTDKYPFVEWGILFSKNKEGMPRYPNKAWIDHMTEMGVDLSAHFCGWWSKEVLENQNFSLITRLHPLFKRVQLNYNFRNSTGWNLVKLLHFALDNPDRGIILQYNKSNSETINKFITNGLPKNIHLLHDSSGGRGAVINKIDPSFMSSYTGYAGGLSNENIDEICTTIRVTKGDTAWIDLESGARTNNNFDLKKVELILSKSELHIIS